MKKLLSLLCLTALCCHGENIIRQNHYGMDKTYDMHPTSRTFGKYITIDPDGRNGKCIRIDCTRLPDNFHKLKFPGMKDRTAQVAGMTWTHYKPELSNDIFQIEVYVKGKGNFCFGLYHYDGNGRHVGIQEAAPQKIDSPNEWKKYTFRITQDLSRPYFIRSCDALVGLMVPAGSDIRLDDMTVTQFNDSELLARKTSSVPEKKVTVQKVQTKKETKKTEKIAGTASPATLKITAAEELRNAKRGSMTAGNKYTQTADGVTLEFDLNTPGEDACMVSCDLPPMDAFNTVKITLDTEIRGQVRPFIVLQDAGGENHYFPVIDSKYLLNQGITGSGSRVLVCPVRIKNASGADRVSQRWGGDRNQRIDFPVKKITLGVDDLNDADKVSGKVTFRKIEFTDK